MPEFHRVSSVFSVSLACCRDLSSVSLACCLDLSSVSLACCLDLSSVSLACCRGLQELDKQEEGYMIRSGIVVILRNATIKDGTTI
jgi:hypothetical protein